MQVNNIVISARSEQVVRIKTSVKNGETIIPYQKMHNCEIPNSLAKDEYALTTVLNNSSQPVTLDISESFSVEKFDNKNLEEIELHTKETDGFKNLVSYIDDFNKQLEKEKNVNNTQNNEDELDLLSVVALPDTESQNIDGFQNDNIDDNETIHTNNEQDPIVGVPITESAVNYGANQIIVSQVLHSPAKTKQIILFEKKR